MRFLLLFILILLPSSALAQSVDILYQGETYTPPFYRGGALWSGESEINLAAIPQGLGNPSTLYYKWLRNGTVLGSLSGVGKNTLKLKDSIFSKSQRVNVQIIADVTEEVVAQGYVLITPFKPEILVYEKHPLLGYLFNYEVGGQYNLAESEVVFKAFPLFFTTVGNEFLDLSFAWRSGKVDSTESLVTYRTPEGESGASRINIKVSNPETLRQNVERSFLVQFNNE